MESLAIFFAIGAGAGLATLAGVRAFLPLAVFMFMARLGWQWGFSVDDTAYDFLQSDAAVYVLLALVIIEVILTRVSSLAALERLLRLPLSLAAGALLMAASIAAEAPWFWSGLVPGAILVYLGIYAYRGLMDVAEGKDPGIALDLSVLFLSVLMMLAPPLGFLLAVFIAWLALRVRRLKRQKYKGLRVLA